MRLFFLGVFGMLGVFSRYFVGLGAQRIFPAGLPYGTFIINMTGCFLIGAAYALGFDKPVISHDMRLALMAGFLGGYTTFSAYGLETLLLIRNDQIAAALGYLFLSPVLGLVACWGGFEMARIVIR